MRRFIHKHNSEKTNANQAVLNTTGVKHVILWSVDAISFHKDSNLTDDEDESDKNYDKINKTKIIHKEKNNITVIKLWMDTGLNLNSEFYKELF